MLYNGFVLDLAKRFQRKFEDMKVVHNFESGSEFEIAVCRVLREILPGRAGICRGYVVSKDGRMAGDDIIVFDAERFPTLRSLGDRLDSKEQVPAEAVLAYIEAKHTLYIDETDAKEHKGQSLEKALGQVSAVKSLVRPRVELSMAGPRSGNSGMQFEPPPGYPNFWNPWYTAIFARYLKTSGLSPQFTMATRLESASKNVSALPDAIVAGDVVTLPSVVRGSGSEIGRASVVPFLLGFAELVSCCVPDIAMGVGTLHLLTAIEWIELGQIPWGEMMVEALNERGSGSWSPGRQPIVSGVAGDASSTEQSQVRADFASWARVGLGLPRRGKGL